MKSLIQGQSIRFDIHHRGNNIESKWGQGLHMHKTMNNDRYNGAQIIVSLDDTIDIEFRKIRGRSKLIESNLKKEISNAFKKDEVKTERLLHDIFDTIIKYSSDLPLKEKVENIRNGAIRIANGFNLKTKVKDAVLKASNKYIRQYLSVFKDENNNEFFIIQDIDGNCIKIGDDIEILKK
ncbi:hypothetical protein [Carboxylicivirga sp. RSCT41]|uniref:hypothetical protein n=1 Tax=Carboxylicivirga agarovorans TaxID=3417570 RepID=UPI003D32CC5A